MNLYRGFVYLTLLLCAGCVKTANIPPADLTLSSFELGPNNLFTVKFTSTVDLVNAFNDFENSNQLTPTLICSLDGDMDFSSEHSINIKAEGLVNAISQTRPNYTFTSELVFYNTRPDGTQLDLNDYEAVRPLLVNKALIPCKVRITAYGYKTYYTKSLIIPATKMREQIFKNP